MYELTAARIRSSFINASRSEAAKLTLPRNFDSLDWDSLDFLGWRDGKMPLRGYLVLPGANGPVGIMLRAIPALLETFAETRDAARARGLDRSPRALLVPAAVRTVSRARATGDALAARGLAD